jgi:hypothetical protein
MWRLLIKTRIWSAEHKEEKHGNKYEPEVALEDKVYLDLYYKHQPRSVVVDEIIVKTKAQGL